MKTRYTKSDFKKFLMLFAFSTVLISCGTYKNVTNDDGIYADETNTKEKKKVVVLNQKEYSKYNKDYFAEELELVDDINNEDIFLDADDYNSIDTVYVDNENTLDYTPNQPWGRGENDVVVNINVNEYPYWMGDSWAYENFIFNRWSYNRFNNWGWGNS